MNLSNELQTTQVEEEAVARALRATQVNDAATGPPRHSQQTDQCPKIARFAAVLKFGDSWTAEEDAHIAGGCPFCQKVFAMFAAADTDKEEELPDVAAPETVFESNAAQETTIESPRRQDVSEDTKLS